MIDTVSYRHSDKCLELIDQTLLPKQVKRIQCFTQHEAASAIKKMPNLSSPAAGIAAAYGALLGLSAKENRSKDLKAVTEEICSQIQSLSPESEYIERALTEFKQAVNSAQGYDSALEAALSAADALKLEISDQCRALGSFGSDVVRDGMGVITSGNAGAFYFGAAGTVTSIFAAASEEGKEFKVYTEETRPFFTGSALTMYELKEAGIDGVLLSGGGSGALLRGNDIGCVISGALKVSSKGFIEAEPGTYALAVLAKYNGVPFYAAALTSAIDMKISYGDDFEISEVSASKVISIGSKKIAPTDTKVFCPASDIIPPELIAGIITEKGIIEPIYRDSIPEFTEK